MPKGTTRVDLLINIGPTVAKRLRAIGVNSRQDLQALGAVAAYERICAQHPGTTMPVCYYLYSLEGALRGVHWDALSPKVKASLLANTSLQSTSTRVRTAPRKVSARRARG